MARPKRLHLLTGRPSRYKLEVASEILTRMSEGESLHRICKAEHLPAEATVRGWADDGRHPGFAEAFRRAQRHQAHRWFEETVEIADESKSAQTVPEIYSAQLRVRARQWASARLAPHEFGDKVDHNFGGSGVVVIIPDNGRMFRPQEFKEIDGEAFELVEDEEAGTGLPDRTKGDE